MPQLMAQETKEQATGGSAKAGFVAELRAFGDAVPHKMLFAVLLVAWAALFHYYGNPTLGYVASHSMFTWLQVAYANSSDDNLGMYMPLIVVALLWWKRGELSAVTKQVWWAPLALFVFALLLHVAGYTVQQTRLSVVAFFLGLYAITGLIWGRAWTKATFFPYFLFAFMLPLTNDMEGLTLPLRQLATKLTVLVSHGLGIDVMQQGTQIFDRANRFQYDVEAACSGLRSLTTMLALACVFAFTAFRGTWKRVLVIGSSVPFAVLGNTLRLLTIVIAAEHSGQKAGEFVHEHWFFSLVPYLPAMVGLMLLARWLREDGEDGKVVPA